MRESGTVMDPSVRRDLDWVMSHHGLPAVDDREIRRLVFLGPVTLEGYCVAVLAARVKAAAKLTGASLGDIAGLAAASDPSAL